MYFNHTTTQYYQDRSNLIAQYKQGVSRYRTFEKDQYCFHINHFPCTYFSTSPTFLPQNQTTNYFSCIFLCEQSQCNGPLYLAFISNQPLQIHTGTEDQIKSRTVKGKGKSVPFQARRSPEGSRKLRFPDYMTTAQDGGRLSALCTHRLYPQEILLVLFSVTG